MVEIVPGKCNKDTCKYSTDGICVNGIENVEDCENFTIAQKTNIPKSALEEEGKGERQENPLEELSATKPEDDSNKPKSQDISFHHGKFLDLISSEIITAENPTQIIVLAGGSDSGKTTLLASLYEMFQMGPFQGFLFSGSKTLPGFEKRCHLARIVSERSKADTERTKTIDRVELLHLRVLKESSGQDDPIELLFTDLSGERFEMVKNSTEECLKLTILSRADHFVLFIDGALLIDLEQRQRAFMDGRSLLRSGLDANMLGKHTLVEIIFSKWDLIEPENKETEHSAFIIQIEELIKSEFADSFNNLSFFKVAARPNSTDGYPFGYNLDKVFPLWVNQTPDRGIQLPSLEINTNNLREMDQFSLKNNSEGNSNGN